MKLVAIVAVVASLALCSLTGTAFAQSPTEDAYGQAEGIAQVAGSGGGSGGGSSGGGSLPFTGLEVGLMALAGAGLLATGFAVRRVSRGGPAGA
jgi:hypothetical protein